MVNGVNGANGILIVNFVKFNPAIWKEHVNVTIQVRLVEERSVMV